MLIMPHTWLRLPKIFISRVCVRFSSSHSESVVTTSKIGEVSLIGINRPEKRNCVDSETARRLFETLTGFEKDDNAKVAVLHGIGGNFCAGFDLEEVAENKLKLPEDRGPMGPTRMILKKPVIAAVSGYAVAGGFELALFCDLRVVEETAVMGVFSRRFGVPLIDGGTLRLQALIGLSRAMDLILTGRAIHAEEALQWGLANRVVACGTALGQAINLAVSLVKFPQACMLADRRATYYSAFSAKNLEDALMFESKSFSSAVKNEAVKGATKFKSGIGRHGKFSNLTKFKDQTIQNE